MTTKESSKSGSKSTTIGLFEDRYNSISNTVRSVFGISPYKAANVGNGNNEAVATALRSVLEKRLGGLVAVDERVFYFDGGCWRAIPVSILVRVLHLTNGLPVDGRNVGLKIDGNKQAHILKLLANKVERPHFFADAPRGINCNSGFIRFADDGTPALVPHDREQRARYVFDAQWPNGTAETPWLDQLRRCFEFDEEADAKWQCLWEVPASALLQAPTWLAQPKAVFAWGPGNTGKSRFGRLWTGFLPKDLVSHVAMRQLAASFDTEVTRAMPAVSGKMLLIKMLLIGDELGHNINDETFKLLVTCEPTSGREVGRRVTEIAPHMQAYFATNKMPKFTRVDDAVARRVLIIWFGRIWKLGEGMEADLVERILDTERDAVLALIVEGASRLIRNGCFTEPASSQQRVREWAYDSDPVKAWIAARLQESTTDCFRVRSGWTDFLAFAADHGWDQTDLPKSEKKFSMELKAHGLQHGFNEQGQSVFRGWRLRDRG